MATGAQAVHSSLTPNVAETVTLTRQCTILRVINRGNSADIFVRADGVDPVVSGENTFVVVRGTFRDFSVVNPDVPEIRLICANAVDYSVECS